MKERHVHSVSKAQEGSEGDAAGESRGLSADDVRVLERERKARWRSANREAYNAYQRRYMRKYRER